MSILESRATFKPYQYSWAVQLTKRHQALHWLPEEVPMAKDKKDWSTMAPGPKHLARNILLLFTQSDMDVGNGYLDHYLNKIKNPEVRFMLTDIAGREVLHVFAYAHLLETLNFSDEEYSEFMENPEMVAKHEAAVSQTSDTDWDLAVTMAKFGGFMEGIQLFASFIMLINFQRHGVLKGMGQIVAWSVRDETLHCVAISRMHREFCHEVVFKNPGDAERMEQEVADHCRVAVENEDRFIDKAFEMGPVEDLTAERVKLFIRYIADVRMQALGYRPLYGVDVDPEPWFEKIVRAQEHANFFENRATAYSKGATTGSYF